ncbi:UNVERIFIED_CONTAM: hypothetical protein Slati_3693500 [Sesamum latifolium]|uniref:CCHC-type domain-containing protein n=1 Tax=Sesamum latifolium TaxID=2727402 RepID=A0AAW2U2N0_9LAMI
MMNLGVATLLGNRIGAFKDMETDNTGRSWGVFLRIRIGLNVNQPLKRALKVCLTSGEELLARLTYEHLPNFCYLCGMLGHIDKYCEGHFEESFRDSGTETPYGPWLRAPLPSRGQFQTSSYGSSNMATHTHHQTSTKTGPLSSKILGATSNKDSSF